MTVTWNPADYHESSSAQQGWARGLFVHLELKGNERILDLGCGDGKVTAELATLVPQGSVLGVDSSAKMVAFASATFAGSQGSGTSGRVQLAFRQEDASSLPFHSEFDRVFSNATLHWLTDPVPAIQGIGRALSPGGLAVLQMGGQGNGKAIFGVLDKLCKEPRWRQAFAGMVSPFGLFGPEDYAKWLPAAGLRPRRIELIPKDMVHPNRAGLAAWIRTTWLPYLERIPFEAREDFISEIVDRYLAEYPLDPRGQTHVAMNRLEVIAEKVAG